MVRTVSEEEVHALLAQLSRAMRVHDSQALLRTVKDLEGIGLDLLIVTRHVAKNGDKLEITSSYGGSKMMVNGAEHVPTIEKYKRILNYLDTHPKEYDNYFIHRNELSPEDYEWICIEPGGVERFDDSKYG